MDEKLKDLNIEVETMAKVEIFILEQIHMKQVLDKQDPIVGTKIILKYLSENPSTEVLRAVIYSMNTGLWAAHKAAKMMLGNKEI